MKLYFAKYLPVEGEIEYGQMGIDYQDELKTWTKKEQDLCDTASVKWFTPVKLFLCSRDIQVGDKVRFQLSKHSPWKYIKCIDAYPEDNTVVLKDEEYTYHTSPDGMNQCFKVIGEISPEAIWVKEGDEFNADEFELGLIGINTTGYRILNPSCKHFH